ncbi:hypothetical protein MRB53_011710 [Persea americana]|uniref:Uncharacterized protein n=1 Tax=Persea americana TaxID=3435 RepID=A0ACC2LW65_PERAE|nr:hypothetical protein MRB53_011710 [Persea americana]
MRKKEKEEKKKGVMMQMQWARGEEEGLPGSGVQRREMARERVAAAGGAAMGVCAAAARSGFSGVAAACVWRIEMEGDGERGDGDDGFWRSGLGSRR